MVLDLLGKFRFGFFWDRPGSPNGKFRFRTIFKSDWNHWFVQHFGTFSGPETLDLGFSGWSQEKLWILSVLKFRHDFWSPGKIFPIFGSRPPFKRERIPIPKSPAGLQNVSKKFQTLWIYNFPRAPAADLEINQKKTEILSKCFKNQWFRALLIIHRKRDFPLGGPRRAQKLKKIQIFKITWTSKTIKNLTFC